MPPAPQLTRVQQRALDYVKDASEAKASAQALADAAEQEFRRRVIAAKNLGCSLDQVARSAGVSKTRIHQIIHGR